MATKSRQVRDARDDAPAAGLNVGQLRELIRGAVRTELDARADGAADPLLTAAELAKALKVTTRTIHNLRGKGLPTKMVMQSPRFVLAEVLSWLDEKAPTLEDFRLGQDGKLKARQANGRWIDVAPAVVGRQASAVIGRFIGTTDPKKQIAWLRETLSSLGVKS